MDIKVTFNEHRWKILASAAMLIVAFWVGWPKSKPYASAGNRWFYNLETQKLEAYVTDNFPPVTLPSGAVGVIAQVFACGSCENAADRFIAYLEKYHDNPMPANAPTGVSEAGPGASYVAEVTDPERWYHSASEPGMKLRNVKQRCPDAIRPCRPGTFKPD